MTFYLKFTITLRPFLVSSAKSSVLKIADKWLAYLGGSERANSNLEYSRI